MALETTFSARLSHFEAFGHPGAPRPARSFHCRTGGSSAHTYLRQPVATFLSGDCQSFILPSPVVGASHSLHVARGLGGLPRRWPTQQPQVARQRAMQVLPGLRHRTPHRSGLHAGKRQTRTDVAAASWREAQRSTQPPSPSSPPLPSTLSPPPFPAPATSTPSSPPSTASTATLPPTPTLPSQLPPQPPSPFLRDVAIPPPPPSPLPSILTTPSSSQSPESPQVSLPVFTPASPERSPFQPLPSPWSFLPFDLPPPLPKPPRVQLPPGPGVDFEFWPQPDVVGPNGLLDRARTPVFDRFQWEAHRSPTRHYRHVASIASSRVVSALGPPVLFVTAVSAAIAAFNDAILFGHLPSWLPLLHVSSLPFQLTAPALALLLVFRTNASYARFDDARRLWGTVNNNTRTMLRQGETWITEPADEHRRRQLRKALVAFSFCLADHLNKQDHLAQDLEKVHLQAHEVAAILASKHRPNYIIQVMSETIYRCSLSEMQRVAFDSGLTRYHDAMGACERIYRTPIPLSYTRLTSRFLIVWHTVLPLALWDQCNWTVVPATFLSAAALFCIEEVGVFIEEPFTILALDSFCQSAVSSEGCICAAHEEIVEKDLWGIVDYPKSPLPTFSQLPRHE